ncbi:MAG: hypothetical protein AAGD00_10150 [Planctomycetota bacterium]
MEVDTLTIRASRSPRVIIAIVLTALALPFAPVFIAWGGAPNHWWGWAVAAIGFSLAFVAARAWRRALRTIIAIDARQDRLVMHDSWTEPLALRWDELASAEVAVPAASTQIRRRYLVLVARDHQRLVNQLPERTRKRIALFNRLLGVEGIFHLPERTLAGDLGEAANAINARLGVTPSDAAP